MHAVIVCDTHGAELFAFDAYDCSQELLGSCVIPKRYASINDYDAFASSLATSSRVLFTPDMIIVLATPVSFTKNIITTIVTALTSAGLVVSHCCQVAGSGQIGFNDVLRTYVLSTTEHDPNTIDDASVTPPPSSTSTIRKSQWLSAAAKSVTSLLTRAR